MRTRARDTNVWLRRLWCQSPWSRIVVARPPDATGRPLILCNYGRNPKTVATTSLAAGCLS